MATIKISDSRSPISTSINCEDEFTGAVSNAVMRVVEARQLQNIRGGIALTKPPVIFAGFKLISQTYL